MWKNCGWIGENLQGFAQETYFTPSFPSSGGNRNSALLCRTRVHRCGFCRFAGQNRSRHLPGNIWSLAGASTPIAACGQALGFATLRVRRPGEFKVRSTGDGMSVRCLDVQASTHGALRAVADLCPGCGPDLSGDMVSHGRTEPGRLQEASGAPIQRCVVEVSQDRYR